MSTEYSNIISSFISNIKNLYGRFWETSEGFFEYYLKLDGYYFCPRQKNYMIVIRVRNKRKTEIISINEIIFDKDYLKELHPFDACILGFIANNERHGTIDKKCIGWQNMCRIRDIQCFVKSEPILEIKSRYINHEGNEVVVLYSKHLNKSIEISTLELFKNQALLYALDSQQAISIGYDAFESHIRNSLSEQHG